MKTTQNKSRGNKSRETKSKRNKSRGNKSRGNKSRGNKSKRNKSKRNKSKRTKSKQIKSKQNHQYKMNRMHPILSRTQVGGMFNVVDDDLNDINLEEPFSFSNKTFRDGLDKLYKLHLSRYLINRYNLDRSPLQFFSKEDMEIINDTKLWGTLTTLEIEVIKEMPPYIFKKNDKWFLMKLMPNLLGGGHDINIYQAEVYKIYGVHRNNLIELPKTINNAYINSIPDTYDVNNKLVVAHGLEKSPIYNWRIYKTQGITEAKDRIKCTNIDLSIVQEGKIRFSNLIFLENTHETPVKKIAVRTHYNYSPAEEFDIYLETIKNLNSEEPLLAPKNYYINTKPLYKSTQTIIPEHPYSYFYVLTEYLENYRPMSEILNNIDNNWLPKLIEFYINIEKRGYVSSLLYIADVMVNIDMTQIKALDYRLLTKHQMKADRSQHGYTNFKRMEIGDVDYGFGCYMGARPFAEYLIRMLIFNTLTDFIIKDEKNTLLHFIGVVAHWKSYTNILKDIFNTLNKERNIHIYNKSGVIEKIEKISELYLCVNINNYYTVILPILDRMGENKYYYNFNNIGLVKNCILPEYPFVLLVLENMVSKKTSICVLDKKGMGNKEHYLVYHNMDRIKPIHDIVHAGGSVESQIPNISSKITQSGVGKQSNAQQYLPEEKHEISSENYKKAMEMIKTLDSDFKMPNPDLDTMIKQGFDLKPIINNLIKEGSADNINARTISSINNNIN